ncbi:imelysin family protein [Marinoscillum furvescens]|uniref:Imelysin-like domain-containing protein n=1 Tax=Marinoscillum furvescens DSM 4134 TaxID=1122208 RepID=A0A3D9L6C4_MARFU|nr:imelysin family protein [Marinoscillum furvescens]REE00450.1 hypothetical protein C7460_10571 [Marinoscillum furvescens DSM 4134]
MRSLAHILFVAVIFTACDTDTDILGKMNDFDQGPMLENFADDLILPAYQNLAEQTASLQSDMEAFTSEPTLDLLTDVRVSLKAARLAWQDCAAFQFGPAEANNLSGILNIYPVDTRQIEQNISSGSYDLRTLANADARGFQALGYLLYSEDLSDEELIASLSANRTQYMDNLAAQIAEVSATVLAEWSAEGDNYQAQFTSESSFGVDVGSSVSKMVNALNLNFERNTRDGKVGIPVGIRSLGEPVLHAVEAYYAGYSVELLNANLQAYYQLYTGGEGTGFDDYLKGIEATTTENEDLADRIDQQFQVVLSAAAQLQDPLPAQIQSNKEAVEHLFAQMQQLVVLFKTEMASSMGVVITYQDNDGD